MAGVDMLTDPENDVMAEFDFLGEGAGEARSSDAPDWGESQPLSLLLLHSAHSPLLFRFQLVIVCV